MLASFPGGLDAETVRALARIPHDRRKIRYHDRRVVSKIRYIMSFYNFWPCPLTPFTTIHGVEG